MSLAILVPVLARPHRVVPLLESIEGATPAARVLFLADPGDQAECAAIRRAKRTSSLRIDAHACGGKYAEKIRVGVQKSTEPFLFLGADDLHFTPGWYEAAAAHLSDEVQVVGVNDLLTRSREHATHFLMTRDYARRPTIDGNRGPLHEGYAHWHCDDELIATAKHRGVYVYAEDAIVKHLHHMNGGAPDDETYRKGRAKAYLDRRLFRRRERLWAR